MNHNGDIWAALMELTIVLFFSLWWENLYWKIQVPDLTWKSRDFCLAFWLVDIAKDGWSWAEWHVPTILAIQGAEQGDWKSGTCLGNLLTPCLKIRKNTGGVAQCSLGLVPSVTSYPWKGWMMWSLRLVPSESALCQWSVLPGTWVQTALCGPRF